MTRFYITLMVAALLTACGHRASNGNVAGEKDSISVTNSMASDEATLKFDSIGLVREDTVASVKVIVDWPIKGKQKLVKSIQQYICKELATNNTQEEKPEIKWYDNGKTAVEATIQKQYQELYAQKKEAFESGFSYGMPYTSYLRIMKLEETENYITLLTNTEGFLGGAHGYATSTGITFRKSDGKILGYSTEYNNEKETFEIKEQTLFTNPESPELALLLKEGVRSYFLEFEQDITTDEQLKDMLIGVDDINHIPLPNNPPFFTKNGLSFNYQQYEIAPYAAGMINFNITYDKIIPFLTKEAAEVLK